jgi:uncharacterized membrane protein
VEFLQLGIGRWLHVTAGVMWIGLLYYFNFVQVPAQAEAAKDGSGAGIARHVAPRALFWFRWAAAATWITGALVLGRHFFDAFLFLKPAYYPIGAGAWLGTLMALNVWLLIWPNQQKALGLKPAGEAEKTRARRTAFLASRVNLMLSIPMLFMMSASGGVFRTAVFG